MSGRYSDEQKRESIRRARELLEQLNAEDAVRAARMAEPEHYPPEPRPLTQSFCDMPLKSSEPMRKWRAEQEAQERRFEQERERREQEHQRIVREQQQEATMSDAGWNSWLKAGIDAAFAEHDRRLTEELGKLVCLERERAEKQVDKRVKALELRIDSLAQELAKARGVDGGGEIIDISPNPVIRKVRVG